MFIPYFCFINTNVIKIYEDNTGKIQTPQGISLYICIIHLLMFISFSVISETMENYREVLYSC